MKMNDEVSIIDHIRANIKYTISIFNENHDIEHPYAITKKEDAAMYSPLSGKNNRQLDNEIKDFIHLIKIVHPEIKESILFEDIKKHLQMVKNNETTMCEFHSEGMEAKYKIKIAKFEHNQKELDIINQLKNNKKQRKSATKS
jgi:hypothetical protein